jgi:hypothetical protein
MSKTEETKKDYYTAPELAEMFGLSIQTIYSRFKSPYARQRWGVTLFIRPDGSIQKVVQEESLSKWKTSKNGYVGRPTRI